MNILSLSRGLLRRVLLVASVVLAMGSVVAAPLTASAQDMDMRFYGYFSEDMTSAIMLGEIQFGGYGYSDAMVSPMFTDEFFDGFTMFENPEITDSLKRSEVSILSRADEYLVYEGLLDSFDGVKPGYVVFLNSSDTMFVVIGYTSDRANFFGLASETIDEGSSPLFFDDYTRVDLT